MPRGDSALAALLTVDQVREARDGALRLLDISSDCEPSLWIVLAENSSEGNGQTIVESIGGQTAAQSAELLRSALDRYQPLIRAVLQLIEDCSSGLVSAGKTWAPTAHEAALTHALAVLNCFDQIYHESLATWLSNAPYCTPNSRAFLAASIRREAIEAVKLLKTAAGPTALSAAPDKPAREQPRRQRIPGSASLKILSGLALHHRYADGRCSVLTPIVINQVYPEWKVSKGAISRFLQKHFGGCSAYCRRCGKGEIAASLKKLYDEYAPAGIRQLGESFENS